jgi:hypothetical protein
MVENAWSLFILANWKFFLSEHDHGAQAEMHDNISQTGQPDNCYMELRSR